MTSAGKLLWAGALLFALAPVTAMAQDQANVVRTSGPVFVSEPVIPTITPAVRDLPDWKPDPNLFGLEMKRRETFSFLPAEYPVEPRVDPLLELQRLESAPAPDSFNTPVYNYAGQSSSVSPPDTTGDVGLTYFLQATNQSVSTVRVIDKNTGATAKTFTMQSLTTASPCKNGFCDPVVLYDRMADRWLISELPSSTGNVCVYVSTSGDPTGTWYAYTFAVESFTDYPKYGVWPQNGNGGSYLTGLNASSTSNHHDLVAFDRAKMLAGQPATFQRFSVQDLANSGFQLVLPSTVQGSAPPPNGEPAIFMRPHDDEAEDGASTPTYDLMDIWKLTVDWATPASSHLDTLTPIHIGDYDMTLCGMGDAWNCMPQPGTAQKIDPIREPLHFPLQYRNFGDHQTLVGCFAEDVDGTDHAAMRWFEMRKTGSGAWALNQEGVIGGEAGVHRSVGSIAMDQSGNIAIGYTRTGTAAPYYPSIYYRGRLATDTPGTMPQGEYVIQNGTYSKTGDERWGDYAGMAVDPSDDCTFWFTTEYMTSNSTCGTRVAAFKFDACGCLSVPAAPVASASATQSNRIAVSWNDSATAAITQYFVSRSTTAGGPYTQIATVADTSPGAGGGAGYTYNDDTVSGGTRYYYVVKSNDGAACTSPASNEVNALAFDGCTLTCSATVPATGSLGFPVGFQASATPSGCTGSPTYAWTFGDGATSTQQNPSHTYATAGTFTWGLTVSVVGHTCTQGGSITVVSNCSLTCGASVSPSSGPAPLSVNFAGSATTTMCPSTNVAFAWTFGDGATSLQKNTTHEYASAGTYTWTMTATSNGLTCTKGGTVTVSAPCVVTCGATASPSTGVIPLSVTFAASATATHCSGDPTFLWSFGDGASSTEKNPTHAYASAGSYTWTLTATADGKTCAQTGTITATEPCAVSCSASAAPAIGTAPLAVDFTASATLSNCAGAATFLWAFGDGASSTVQNPGHTFAAAGSYAWTLTATADGKSCSRTGTVAVSEPCTLTCEASAFPAAGAFPLTVAFAATATPSHCAGAATFLWSFGDGASSTEQNPGHTYAAIGSYAWTLTATADGKSCSRTGTVVVVEPCTLSCEASASPAAGAAPLAVTFTASATPDHCTAAASFLWSFGDGTTSTEQNPGHTYAAAGSFAWTLTATADGKTCTRTGTIATHLRIPGDGDDDGTVSIGEVQQAINMFLGAQPPGNGVDCNGDGVVSIGEVQKVINAFLGVTTTC